MRRYVYILLFLIIAAMVVMPQWQPGSKLTPSGSQALDVEIASLHLRSNLPDLKLHYCYNKILGVRFLCDFGWPQYGVGRNLTVFINDNPEVTMNVLKVGMDVLFIDQLNRDKLKGLGRYEDGFAIEQGLEVTGLKAIKVKAFQRNNPQTRLSDYYFIHRGDLYAIMFSAMSKEAWEKYQFLFEDIVDHFEFWRPTYTRPSLPRRIFEKMKRVMR